jgi:hypothetical protein
MARTRAHRAQAPVTPKRLRMRLTVRMCDKFAVRRFPDLMPDRPDADGAAIARRARVVVEGLGG